MLQAQCWHHKSDCSTCHQKNLKPVHADLSVTSWAWLLSNMCRIAKSWNAGPTHVYPMSTYVYTLPETVVHTALVVKISAMCCLAASKVSLCPGSQQLVAEYNLSAASPFLLLLQAGGLVLSVRSTGKAQCNQSSRHLPTVCTWQRRLGKPPSTWSCMQGRNMYRQSKCMMDNTTRQNLIKNEIHIVGCSSCSASWRIKVVTQL